LRVGQKPIHSVLDCYLLDLDKLLQKLLMKNLKRATFLAYFTPPSMTNNKLFHAKLVTGRFSACLSRLSWFWAISETFFKAKCRRSKCCLNILVSVDLKSQNRHLNPSMRINNPSEKNGRNKDKMVPEFFDNHDQWPVL
jgi:hypothetical protein